MIKYCLNTVLLIVLSCSAFADNNELLKRIETHEKTLELLKEQIALQEKQLMALKKQLQAQKADSRFLKEKAVSNNVNGIKISGDFRARGESILPDDSSIEDRGRLRFRLRVSLDAKINSHFSFFGRLASGTDVTESGEHLGGSITSNNQTFDDFFEQKPIWIDRAFLKYTSTGGLLEVMAGKIGRPWKNTRILFDKDLSAEGIMEKINLSNHFYIGLGQFVIDEQKSQADTTLLSIQTGFTPEWGQTRLGAYLTYYDYRHFSHNFKISNGNTVDYYDGNPFLAAGDFNILDTIIEFNHDISSKNLNIVLDYAVNTACRTQWDTAWKIGITYGSENDVGDWLFRYNYFYIEPDATPSIFNDSDHGYTDSKGHALKLYKNILKNTYWNFFVYSVDSVTGNSPSFTLIKTDVSVKF